MEAFKLTLARFEAARAVAKGSEKSSLTAAISRITWAIRAGERDAEYARTH